MNDASTGESRHILYVDDDPALVFLIRRLLQRRGYAVTALTDQQAAIDAVRNRPESFHLLITDYKMPGLSGLEVASRVREFNPRLPVALASGFVDDELQALAAAAGVTEVVVKSDAIQEFCDVVARLMVPR